MGAPKEVQQQRKNPLAATHDWVLMMDASNKPHGSSKKTFMWVPKVAAAPKK